MYIESLTLENFRSYGDSHRFDFGDRALIIGENGAGKSTVIDAIQWVLTGRCRGIDGAGKGQKDLIRTGAGKMAVTIKLRGLDAIKRTFDKGGRMTTSVPQDAILAKLDTTIGYLTAVLNGGVFFDLHHADAKKLLMGLLNVVVAPDQLPGLESKDGQPWTLDALEERYKQAVADRLVAKRVLAGIVVPEVMAKTHLHGLKPDVLKQELAELQTAYRDAARAEAAAAEATRSVQARVNQANASETQLPHLEAKLAAHQEMLVQERSKLQGFQAVLADAVRPENGNDLAAKASEARVLIGKIETHDPDRGCVLNAAIPCLTDAKRFQGQVDDLKAGLAQIVHRIAEAAERSKELARAEADVRSAETNITYHEKQEHEAQGKVNSAKEVLAVADQLVKNLAEVVQAEKKASAALAAAKTAAEAKGAVYAEVVAYAAAMGAKTTAETSKQLAQDDVARQEQLVELLGPNGVRLQALDLAVTDFLDALNAVLAPFGFTVALQVDPWEVRIVKDAGVGIMPYGLLSAGERLFTGLAFQAALAGLSGLDFYAVDAVETVVGARRKVLTDVVMQAPIGQTIVAMAKGVTDDAPEIDGLQVIRLEDVAAVPA